MFEFLFGRSKKNLKPPAVVEAVNFQPKNNEIRLEMVRLALKSVLRRYGIPIQWIGCEIEPMPASGDSDVLLIQLVLLKWHEALMRYASELQKQFLTEIQFFDNTAHATNFLIVWKFAPDCGCPHDKLPEAAFWATAAEEQPVPLAQSASATPLAAAAASAATLAPPAAIAPAAVLPAAKFDLPKSKLDEVEGDDGFPATQIFEQK
ncbi:MAG: hypothetical protein CO105_11945 [Comamonadaceae bacterium CG_4_9_14_3_um_filter_60_33]|nr:MAG: hypothetical protein COZ09_05495 [Comamonadaceae bacterium CG_4_10_14_3_um_filter_60_42]PJB42023.1 MAG: hypothetical protein CO105_11945 [Comamonadaceae bacterium CG_4_9_14_3_um_filter_60_33]